MAQGKHALRTLGPFLFPLGTAIFWGANFNASKVALFAMPAITVAAWRFILAACCISLITTFKERPTWQQIRAHAWIYVLLGVLGVFGTNSLVYLGLQSTSAVNASLVMATNPLVTLLLSTWLLRERITYWQLLGIGLSLAGVAFVLTGGAWLNIRTISLGDVSVFGGNLCFALYSVLGKKYLAEDTALNRSAFPMIVGSVCFLPFVFLPTASPSTLSLTEAWLAIGYMALFGSVLSYIWWNEGISRLGAGKASIFFNVVPVATMLVALITGSSLTFAQIGGALFVVAGVWMGSRRSEEPETQKEIVAQEARGAEPRGDVDREMEQRVQT